MRTHNGDAVCERWDSFENFLADMGEKPTRSALERLDASRDYEPGNCRWFALHGHSKQDSPTYRSWLAMRQRCLSAAHRYYDHYGGRGIKICDRWDDFASFIADLGPRPDGMTLDRIDVNGNYEPSNCRWATKIEQKANQRLSAPRVEAVLAEFEAEAPELIARLRTALLGK